MLSSITVLHFYNKIEIKRDGGTYRGILSKFRIVIQIWQKYNVPFLKLSVDLEEESFYNDMLKA